ncbi:MAG TPA: hypothetical protein VFX29_03610, partial [Longimicrobiaceae bacterium]|nr:hypothetical protein [Longimicrobiaceae bacterium]
MAGFTAGAKDRGLHFARTREAADRFLTEVRREVERAIAAQCGTPPRLRSIHERPGHATPEYRNLAIPVPDGIGGTPPDVLSATIARYAEQKRPDRLLLAIDAAICAADGAVCPVLIVEARDRAGTRLFWMQGYTVEDGRVAGWADPHDGGWRDPGAEAMILDAAFTNAAVPVVAPAPPAAVVGSSAAT